MDYLRRCHWPTISRDFPPEFVQSVYCFKSTFRPWLGIEPAEEEQEAFVTLSPRGVPSPTVKRGSAQARGVPSNRRVWRLGAEKGEGITVRNPRANRRDFLHHRIARHFRSLPRQGFASLEFAVEARQEHRSGGVEGD